MKSNVNTDRVYSFDVTCHAEIRGCELIDATFKTKDGQDIHTRYLELTCEDDALNRFYIKDRLVDNQSMYRRGMTGTFVLQIHVEDKFRGKTQVNLKEFVPDATN